MPFSYTCPGLFHSIPASSYLAAAHSTELFLFRCHYTPGPFKTHLAMIISPADWNLQQSRFMGSVSMQTSCMHDGTCAKKRGSGNREVTR